MKNRELARIFDEIADMLEFEGDDPFKIRAYRRAAGIIGTLETDITKLTEEKKLESIPGIGKAIAKKIDSYLKTGKIEKHLELKEKIPPGIFELLRVPGLGTATIRKLYNEIGVKDIESLENSIRSGNILRVSKIREKTVEKIKKGIKIYKANLGKIPLGSVLPDIKEVVRFLKQEVDKDYVSEAGDLRRRTSTVEEIKILIALKDRGKLKKLLSKAPFVFKVEENGEGKISVEIEDGIKINIITTDKESFGSALLYYTGSNGHLIKLKSIAQKKGYFIDNGGVFNATKQKIRVEREEEIYRALGMQYIPPELREDRGEIEEALKKNLPSLVEQRDIKGDFHIHSRYSDGSSDLETLENIAREYGYEYIGIADHSKSLKIARGLSIERLREKNSEIDRINKKGNLRLLKCAEVDILPDGSLDYPDDVLKELDIVIASVHTRFNLSEKEMTERICKALKNKYVKILAHPSGVLIGERDPYPVDWDRVFEVARNEEKALEINAYYLRLDLNDELTKEAASRGVMLSIGSDAHRVEQMWMMELGVGLARRGWCAKGNILNTLSLSDLIKWLRE